MLPSRSLEAFAPVSLEELDGLQDRVDVKYVISTDTFAALADELRASHRVLEIEGRRSFTYRTTYFDTADLRVFRDHQQRRRRRYKARSREYVDTGARAFEVKLKGARGRTVKHRMPYDRDGLSGPALAFLRETVEREYGRAPEPGLRYRAARHLPARDVRRARRAADVRLRPALRRRCPARAGPRDRREQVRARARDRRSRPARARRAARGGLLEVLPRRRADRPARQAQRPAPAPAQALRRRRGGPGPAGRRARRRERRAAGDEDPGAARHPGFRQGQGHAADARLPRADRDRDPRAVLAAVPEEVLRARAARRQGRGPQGAAARPARRRRLGALRALQRQDADAQRARLRGRALDRPLRAEDALRRAAPQRPLPRRLRADREGRARRRAREG